MILIQTAYNKKTKMFHSKLKCNKCGKTYTYKFKGCFVKPLNSWVPVHCPDCEKDE